MFTIYVIQIVLLLWMSGNIYTKPVQEKAAKKPKVVEACMAEDWTECKNKLTIRLTDDSLAYEQLQSMGDYDILPKTAARKGYTELIDVLLSHGVKINSLYSALNMSMLHFAALNGHINTVQLLISHGADVNMGDLNGDTPLYEAIRKGNTDIMELLIESGADCKSNNTVGVTPLDIANVYRNGPVMKCLAKHGCGKSSVNKDGVFGNI